MIPTFPTWLPQPWTAKEFYTYAYDLLVRYNNTTLQIALQEQWPDAYETCDWPGLRLERARKWVAKEMAGDVSLSALQGPHWDDASATAYWSRHVVQRILGASPKNKSYWLRALQRWDVEPGVFILWVQDLRGDVLLWQERLRIFDSNRSTSVLLPDQWRSILLDKLEKPLGQWVRDAMQAYAAQQGFSLPKYSIRAHAMPHMKTILGKKH